MANFGAMFQTLRLQVQGNVDDGDLKATINNCQRQICESYDWTFLDGTMVVNSVVPHQNGTVTLSTGSPNVIGSGTSFNVNDAGAFFWAGGQVMAPVPVQSVQGQILTLQSPWPGPSVIGSAYILAPLYYPLTGALEVQSVRQIDYLEKLTRDKVNRRDPARIFAGATPALVWCNAPHAEDGSVQIELWPTAGDARPYLCEVKLAAPLLIDTTDQPLCPSAVLEAKSLMDACLSAYATTGNQQWVQLADRYQARYLTELEDARIKNADRQRHRTMVEPPSRRSIGPGDSQYFPTHDTL